MTDTPKVSIVLPFYNSKSTLEKAIESIVNQIFKDFELLLIDNGSTDDSSAIAEKFADQDQRIKVFFERQRGVVFAANNGLSNSRGEYIARMDADDVSLPNRIADQVKLLDAQLEIGLVSGLVRYAGDDSNGGFIRYVNWSNGITRPEALYLNQFVEYPIVNPSIMIRRELYKEYGGYRDGDFPEDYEFFLRLQSHNIQMIKTDSVVLEWNDLPHRLTRTSNKYTSDAFFQVKAKYLSKWLRENNTRHPRVIIWGGGKLARRRSKYLEQHGVVIDSFIDVRKSSDPALIYYEDTELFKNAFILSFVSNWDARDQVRTFLNEHAFVEGQDYLICA
ncbi:MAG: glycosyltransferase [Cyclobacteriaceae bacterium]